MSARVGIFDSGVGGLSVWREIALCLPALEIIYVADQAHIPYGPRPAAEIRALAEGIARFLVERGCTTIVVACNTASAAALSELRRHFADVAFVGMEPAVKPAAESSRRRVAGVLATPATLQGALFATTVERFAAGVRLVRQVCPGLVERIEAGDVDGPETEAMLRQYLEPSVAAGADTLVLACTHYAFVRPLIERLAGPGVRVIDPAPAIARQVERVVAATPAGARPAAPGAGSEPRFYTTGAVETFERTAAALLGQPLRARQAVWEAGRLLAREPA